MRWLFECFELKSEFTSKCLWWSIHPSNVGFKSWKYNSNTKHILHLISINYFQLLIIMKRLNGRGSVTWKNIVLEQDLFWSQISLIGHICVVLLYAVCQSERVYLYKETRIRVTQLLFWLQASRVPTSVQNCCFQCLVSDFHVFCHTASRWADQCAVLLQKGTRAVSWLEELSAMHFWLHWNRLADVLKLR